MDGKCVQIFLRHVTLDTAANFPRLNIYIISEENPIYFSKISQSASSLNLRLLRTLYYSVFISIPSGCKVEYETL